MTYSYMYDSRFQPVFLFHRRWFTIHQLHTVAKREVVPLVMPPKLPEFRHSVAVPMYHFLSKYVHCIGLTQ